MSSFFPKKLDFIFCIITIRNAVFGVKILTAYFVLHKVNRKLRFII